MGGEKFNLKHVEGGKQMTLPLHLFVLLFHLIICYYRKLACGEKITNIAFHFICNENV